MERRCTVLYGEPEKPPFAWRSALHGGLCYMRFLRESAVVLVAGVAIGLAAALAATRTVAAFLFDTEAERSSRSSDRWLRC